MELKEKKCAPCEGGAPPLPADRIRDFLTQVSGWAKVERAPIDQIAKSFRFRDFVSAMAFVDKMAAVAEQEGHHPDFCVHYDKVEVTIWTHAVGGLSENDFILAAKIDAIA